MVESLNLHLEHARSVPLSLELRVNDVGGNTNTDRDDRDDLRTPVLEVLEPHLHRVKDLEMVIPYKESFSDKVLYEFLYTHFPSLLSLHIRFTDSILDGVSDGVFENDTTQEMLRKLGVACPRVPFLRFTHKQDVILRGNLGPVLSAYQSLSSIHVPVSTGGILLLFQSCQNLMIAQLELAQPSGIRSSDVRATPSSLLHPRLQQLSITIGTRDNEGLENPTETFDGVCVILQRLEVLIWGLFPSRQYLHTGPRYGDWRKGGP
ncbi:hypothetical protein V5O48_011267 [Marasmius crinis-equi]|uniref:Uncharacterized protein n=1 Tax=Marasmius crinis-equi TaxID=585013 RepID=A0ABR3F633_9AGAR